MKSMLSSSRDFLVAIFLMCFLVLACQLDQETMVENTLSFSKHYDSLSRYDTLGIEVKDQDGKSLGVIYYGKPTAGGQLDNLLVPKWDGRPIDIFISGYMKDHVGAVYQVKKRYDSKNDTTVTVVLIDPNPATKLPSSLTLVPDTLRLAEHGAAKRFTIHVEPPGADQGIDWHLSDSTIAAQRADGAFLGLARGTTRVTATSKLKREVGFTGWIIVTEPMPVASVRFLKDSLSLFIGGAPESLQVEVLPLLANSEVIFSLSDSTKATLAGHLLSPKAAGAFIVKVRSQEDSTKTALLPVSVRAPVRIEAVVAADSAALLFMGGPGRTLTAKVLPENAPQDVRWKSLSPAIASVEAQTGAVAALQAGLARIVATSLADSLQRDTVAVTVEVTSVVSIEAPKNNSITNQKRIQVDWSVNGVPQDSLKNQDLVSGPNVISRSARNSAGKIATTTVTVTLDTAAPLKPVISGSSPTNVKPKWTWISGGGGSGEYRYRLGDATFPADAPTVHDSAYTLASIPVSGTTYTLYLEERDLAGNWSVPASLPIRYDVTAPVVAITGPQTSGIYFTSGASVTLTGTASGPVAISQVDYKVGSGASAKATLTGETWSTAAIPLTEGSSATVTVTAIDQAGSTGVAVLTVLMDATAPAAPTIATAPAAEINVLKGDFAWAAGTDGAAGSGLNGHYRYSINGGPWKDTTATLLTNLPLLEGANVFALQEQDRAQLWSLSATKNVRVDATGPTITLTSPASTANYASLTITLSGQVKDSGTAVAGMTVVGQQAGSGTVTIASGTWTSAALTLKAGANALSLVATDRVGNATTLAVTVNVSLAAPKVTITIPTDSLTITRSDTITVSYTIDAGAVQTKGFALTEGVNRLIVTSLANASDKTGSDTVKVTMDATAPPAPTVTPGATPTKTAATWTLTAPGGDNPGGAGLRSPLVFQYSLDAGVTWTQATTTPVQKTTEGTWTLIAQVQDKAGNWSASSAGQTIVVDKTAPVVFITRPANNYVTSLNAVPIYYKVGSTGTEQKYTPDCDVSGSDGAKTCTVSSTDAANNTGTATITVYHRSKAVFCTPGGAGIKSGVDWQNAMDAEGLQGAMDNSKYTGKDFWVGDGIYALRLQASYSMTLYGGFDADNKPYDLTGRSLVGTRFAGYFQATPVLTTMTLILDRIVLNEVAISGSGNTTNLKDVTMDDNGEAPTYGINLMDNGTITATNFNATNRIYGTSVLKLGGTFNMVGGSITGNSTTWGRAVDVPGKMTLSNGAAIAGNVSQQQPGSYQVDLSGTLTIGSGVNFSCSSVFLLGGDCK